MKKVLRIHYLKFSFSVEKKHTTILDFHSCFPTPFLFYKNTIRFSPIFNFIGTRFFGYTCYVTKWKWDSNFPSIFSAYVIFPDRVGSVFNKFIMEWGT